MVAPWFRVKGHVKVPCRCQCGKQKAVFAGNLQRGLSQGCTSCGLRTTPPAWEPLRKRVNAARQRCTNTSDRHWRRYGGRGIRFLFPSVDAGIRWVAENLPGWESAEIDRIDNNGHYGPGNLRLVTRRGNVNNRESTALVLWKGSLVPVTLWAENPYGYGPAYRYVKQGLTGEQIVAQARKAVTEKRKGWRRIEERLAHTIY